MTSLYTRTQVTMYNYTWHIPLAFVSPCQFPFSPLCIPFYLLGTLLAVTGIVHLGLRLLVHWPPLPHPSPKPSPLQIPRTPTAQRLTKTTSGIFRLLLSGTILNNYLFFKNSSNLEQNIFQGAWTQKKWNVFPSLRSFWQGKIKENKKTEK